MSVTQSLLPSPRVSAPSRLVCARSAPLPSTVSTTTRAAACPSHCQCSLRSPPSTLRHQISLLLALLSSPLCPPHHRRRACSNIQNPLLASSVTTSHHLFVVCKGFSYSSSVTATIRSFSPGPASGPALTTPSPHPLDRSATVAADRDERTSRILAHARHGSLHRTSPFSRSSHTSPSCLPPLTSHHRHPQCSTAHLSTGRAACDENVDAAVGPGHARSCLQCLDCFITRIRFHSARLAGPRSLSTRPRRSRW